jgi:hypothetical protein
MGFGFRVCQKNHFTRFNARFPKPGRFLEMIFRNIYKNYQKGVTLVTQAQIRCAASTHSSNGATKAIRTRFCPGLMP